MNTPLISIIVPVYNVEAYLPHCLDSLVGQTLKDIEIICVDDGSTDGSGRILEEYAARDARVRVLTQANAGQGAARNVGLDAALSPFIMFCDSDDWYELNMCEKMLTTLQAHPYADMVMCGYRNEWERELENNEEAAWLEDISISGYQKLTENVMHESLIGPPFKIYRREFIDQEHIRFPEGVRYEDYYFWNVCAAHARGVYYLPDKLYHYRQRAGSTMHNSIRRSAEQNKDYIRIGMLLWEYYKERHFEKMWGGFLAEIWAQMVINALRYSPDAAARGEITRLVRDFIIRECKSAHGQLSGLLLNALICSLSMPTIKEKKLCGLLRCRYTLTKINIHLCGIPLCSIRRKGASITWSVLGLSYRRVRENKNGMTKTAFQNTCNAVFYAAYIRRINRLYSVSFAYSPQHQAFVLAPDSTV